MKNTIGMLFLLVGLSLIAVGSYNGFESYNKELIKNNADNLIDGIYVFENEKVIVSSLNEGSLGVLINNETYEFENKGDIYENSLLGLVIEFKNNSLIISKDGQEVSKYIKNDNNKK